MAYPDETVRRVIYPVAEEVTLRELAEEAKAEGTVFNEQGPHGAARFIFPLLPADVAPVVGRAGVQLQQPRLPAGDGRHRAVAPLHGHPSSDRPITPARSGANGGVVLREAGAMRWSTTPGRIERIPYELCVLGPWARRYAAGRSGWAGANRWRNPEDDLPADFDDNRDVHYPALRPFGWRRVRRGAEDSGWSPR